MHNSTARQGGRTPIQGLCRAGDSTARGYLHQDGGGGGGEGMMPRAVMGKCAGVRCRSVACRVCVVRTQHTMYLYLVCTYDVYTM